LLGILAVQKLLSEQVDNSEKIYALKWSVIIVAGIALFFTLFGSYLFAFESFRDLRFEKMLEGFTSILVEDRRTIFFQDSLRTLIAVSIIASIIWLYLDKKINKNIVLGALLIAVLVDMVGVAKRYVNNDDFISASKLEKPFAKSAIDAEIQKDKGHYRVMNFMVNPMNDGSTSFFHNSVGGYHAAKPRRYQELFDFQISRNNMDVLNMLNTKYIIFPDDKNQPQVQLNEEANGNAWYVDSVKFVDSANDEIKALDSLNTKQTAIVHSDYKDQLDGFEFQLDTTAGIKLISYQANDLVYESSSKVDQLAVFSEMYYKDGWNAYVDGELTPHFRVNYVLRAMVIPKGKHKIEFKFEPQVIKQGNTITLISYALLLIIPLGWYFKYKKKDGKSSQ